MHVVLLLAGGVGSRMGLNVPKQYYEVAGRPLIAYCLDGMAESSSVDAIQIVADEEWKSLVISLVEAAGLQAKLKGFSMPGDNRQLSIYNGLRDIRKYADGDSMVMVHDAATADMIDSYFSAAEGKDGVLPCLPMKDTIYHSGDGKTVTGLLNRSELFAGQAPEIYRLDKYLAANESLLPDKIMQINGAAEPAIMAGMDIGIVPGEERNFKITTLADLERFEKML